MISLTLSVITAVQGQDWKDWNTPTPIEGKRVENLYDFAKYVVCEGTLHRYEFELTQDVNDAWLTFQSFNSAVQDHRVWVNHELVFEHKADAGLLRCDRQFYSFVKPQAFVKGKNVVWAESCWFAASLVVHLKDGTQKEIIVGPGWTSGDTKAKGWDEPGYTGAGYEMHYRLGWEGYHVATNKFANRPYQGLIQVDMGRKMPVYRRGETVRWVVTIPQPFYGLEKPALSYKAVDCFDDAPAIEGKGTLVGVAQDQATYRLTFPAQRVGAYTMEVSLGEPAALKRKLELVIYDRIEQPQVDADQLFNSLKTTLVDQVNCTANDPTNPVIQCADPTLKTEGKVVRSGGLEYFQTGTRVSGALDGTARRDAYAMWRLSAKELNTPYLVEVDIPDDLNRVQTIALVHNTKGIEYGYETTVEMGIPRPLTGKMYTHRMVFTPKFHDVRIMIAPAYSDLPPSANSRTVKMVDRKANGAAVAAIRFYRIDSPLPAVRLGNSGRIHSVYSERANLITASYYPGSEGTQLFSPDKSASPDQYRRWYLALREEIKIMKMAGQTAFMPGLYMYQGRLYSTLAEQTDYISMMEDMYQANDIGFYGNISYVTSSKIQGAALGAGVKPTDTMRIPDTAVAAGQDTYQLVNRRGKQQMSVNPIHPVVREDVLGLVGEIMQRFGKHPNFKGLQIFNGLMGSALNFQNPDNGYEDLTYQMFRTEVRPEAPVFEGSARFRQRYDWIRANAWSDFEKFRCRKVYETYRMIAQRIKQDNPNAKLWVQISAWPWQGYLGNATPEEVHQHLLDTGTDPELYARDPDMVVMHADYMGAHINTNHYLCDAYNHNPKIWNLLTDQRSCGVFFWTGYYEKAMFFPPQMSNPQWGDYGEKRFIGSAGRNGRNYLSSFTNAFAYANPILFANRLTDVADHRGFLAERAEASQAMSFIPQGDYQRVEGSTDDTVLRRCGDQAYFVNNIYHPTTVVVISSAQEAALTNTIKNVDLKPMMVNGHCEWTIQLKPYEILPVKVRGAGGDWKIKSLTYDQALYDGFMTEAAQHAAKYEK